MRPSLGKFQTGTGDKVRYDSRNKHFAGQRLGHDAGCGMHGDPSNIPTSHFDLTGMETRAQWQTDLLRGSSERQSTANAAARSIESRQNAVPCRLDENSA